MVQHVNAQIDIEKILQEAQILGEEGIKTNNFQKLQEARAKALSVINQDASTTRKAYEVIGDLYFNSHKICAKGNAVISRGAFLMAYDAYAKANHVEKMKQARLQFPSITDIFILNMKEGEEISVDCWNNEKTILRLRPKL